MKITKSLITGLGIGFICTTFFMILFMGFNEFTLQMLVWLIASGIYGVSSLIFDNENISVILKYIIHYIISLSVTIIIAFLLYKPYVSYVAISFNIAYFIIIFILWQIDKKNVKKINEKLNQIKWY